MELHISGSTLFLQLTLVIFHYKIEVSILGAIYFLQVTLVTYFSIK